MIAVLVKRDVGGGEHGAGRERNGGQKGAMQETLVCLRHVVLDRLVSL